jgi:fatty acid desaturase
MTATNVEQLHPHDFQGRVPARLPGQVIRELSVLRPHKAIAAVVLEWVYILAAIALCEKLRSPLVYAAAVIWIGARQHALTVLGHDAAHYRLLPGRRLNDWLANLLMQWPTFISVESFRYYHGEHHRFTGTAADGNRKIWGTHTSEGQLTEEWTYPKNAATLVWTIVRRGAVFTGLFWIVRGLVATILFRRSWMQVAVRLSYYGGAVWAFSAGQALRGFLLYWIVPFCTWHMACQYMRLISEHSAVPGNDPAYRTTRTTLARRWERWLIVPRNIHYHIEHHWYPSVPFYNLPTLHARLMAQPEFREQAVVTTSLMASLRQCIAR